MLPRSPLFWIVAILILAGVFSAQDPAGFKHFAHGVGTVVGLIFSGLFAILGLL